MGQYNQQRFQKGMRGREAMRAPLGAANLRGLHPWGFGPRELDPEGIGPDGINLDIKGCQMPWEGHYHEADRSFDDVLSPSRI